MTISNKPFARTVLLCMLLTLAASLPAANAIKMKNGDFVKTIPLTGSLQAAQFERFVVPVTSNWRIQIKWMAKEGDYVKPGDPVVRFDTANLASEKENIQMTLRDKEESRVQKINDFNFQKFELEVKLKQADIDLKKCEIDAAIPKGLETNLDYDKKQLALKQSKQAFADAQVEKNVKLGTLTSEIAKIEIEIKEERAKLDKIHTQLESLVLIAKTAGTLVYGINRWEDRKVAVDDNVFATMTVATIPASDSLQVEAWMNETAVLFLRTGHHVDVRLDAYPSRIFKGVVQDVLNSAESRRMWGRSHYFSVIIKLDTLDQSIMKPGMSVLCQVEVARQKDVWLVPLQAVQFDGQGYALTPKGQKKCAVNALGFNQFYLALDKKEAAAKGLTADTLLMEPVQTETPIFLKELPNEKK